MFPDFLRAFRACVRENDFGQIRRTVSPRVFKSWQSNPHGTAEATFGMSVLLPEVGALVVCVRIQHGVSEGEVFWRTLPECEATNTCNKVHVHVIS